MLLINKGDLVLQSDRRLVRATDAASVRNAAEIVAAAEAEASRIREEAKAAFEEEKRRGYEKGIQDGKMEIAMQKLDQVEQAVEFMESVEGKMADVVMKALRSCDSSSPRSAAYIPRCLPTRRTLISAPIFLTQRR